MTYHPKALETEEIAFGDMVIEWYKIEPGVYAVGKIIGDLHNRKCNGATIREGATIVIIGENGCLKVCKQLLFYGRV